MSEDSEFDAGISGLDEMAGLAEHASEKMAELREEMRNAGKEADQFSGRISGSLNSAIGRLVVNGASASDVLRSLGASVSGKVLNSAVSPITDAISGGIGSVLAGAFEKGAAFSSGNVRAFAGGGVVDGPQLFPMRGGNVGLMGEAGPEAIMPLSRGADGRLGIAAQSAGHSRPVVVNIQTNDVAAFRRSRSQIAAQIGRAVRFGARNQ